MWLNFCCILPNPPLEKEGVPLFFKEGLGEIKVIDIV